MSKKASNIDMLQGPIAIKMTMLAIPIILTAILQQLFNSADMVVVGRYAGSNALAAVGANTFIINLMVNLFAGLSIGSNVVIARLIGQGDKVNIGKAVHTSVLIAALSGLILTSAGCLFAEPILRLIDTPENVISDAAVYLRIYFMGMPFYMLYNFISALLRAKGDTRRPLYVLAAFGVVNVILNLFFVVNCGMGVAGVALATLISSSCSALVLVWLLAKESGSLKLHINKLGIDIPSLKEIARIGLPTGLQGVVFSISNVIIQDGINSLGADAMAASTASLTFDFISYFAMIGFAQSGMSFLSQNLGARQMARCRRIVWITLALGVGASFCVSWMSVILRDGLSGLFTTSETVIALSATRMIVVLPFYFIHSINEVLSALLRAVGYSLAPALICTICICGTRILWVNFVFPQHHTYGVLNSCYAISWGVTSLIMIPTAFFILRKIIYKVEHAFSWLC